MAKALSLKTGGNGKLYLDVTLGDSTGEINGKKWDVSEAESAEFSRIADGDLIKVRGQVTEWNGIKQLRIGKLRKYDP